MTTLRSIILLFTMLLLLPACTGVENLAGVELATVAIAPTPTPAPTATPNPAAIRLPNSVTKDFLGTTVELSYPEGWEQREGGQSLNIWDASVEAESPPGVGLFISLLRTVGIDEPDGPVAARAMHLFLARAAEGGFVDANSAPGPEDAYAFTWGGHDAAIFLWQNVEADVKGINVVVIDSDARRMVLLGTESSPAAWDQLVLTWQAIMSSVVLDGDALPLSDLDAAYAAVSSQ